MAVRAVIAGAVKYESKQIRDLPPVATDLNRINNIFADCHIEVIDQLRNPGRTSLLTKLRKACQQAGPNDDLILYFSGHGQAYKGRDFLVPVDAEIDDFGIIEQVLVPVDLDGALQEAEAASITMIIDACREGIELTTKSVDFSTWSFQQIGDKTSMISIVFSCGHGEYSHVLSKDYGSLFTASLCEAIADREYGVGSLDNIMAATQNYVLRNAERFGKEPQKLVIKASRVQGDAKGPILFPPGKRLLEEEIASANTGWHPSCDFLLPEYSRIYESWEAGHRGEGVTITQISETVYDAHVEFRNTSIGKVFVSTQDEEKLEGYHDVIGDTLVTDVFDFGDAWRKVEQRIRGRGAPGATAVASVLCGKNVGICPLAQLINIGVTNEGETTTDVWRLIRGLAKAASRDDVKRPILLFSFGGYFQSVALETAFEPFHDKALVICPAGNSPEQGVAFPASLPDVLSVGAVDRQLRIEPFSDYRSHGHSEPDIYGLSGGLLPGSSSPFEYAPQRGTSFAAAYVAGVAALVWSANPAMTPAQLRAHLVRNAGRLKDETAKAGLAVAEWRFPKADRATSR